MTATEQDLLGRLAEEAERLRGEAYPGSLLDDIRLRLDASPAGKGRSWPWLLPAAAAILLVSWLGQRRPEPPAPLPGTPASSSAAASVPSRDRARARPAGLSPFQTVAVPAPRAVHLPTLSATGLPSVGTALGDGARALSQVRPVSLDSMKEDEP